MIVAWAVPVLFILLAAWPPLDRPGSALVAPLSLCCALASAVYLTSIRGRLWQTLWSRIVFAVFIFGYLAKGLLYLYSFQKPEQVLWYELDWLAPSDVLSSYPIFAIGFCTFCLVAAVLALVKPSDNAPTSLPEPPASYDPARLRTVLWLTVLLCVVTTVLPLLLGFGVMGSEEAALPFRLDAPITRFRINIGPALLLWILWVSDRSSTIRTWRVGLAGLLAVGVFDGFVRSSRGSIAALMFPAVLLWLLTRRMTRPRLGFGIGVFALFVLLYPIFTYQRTFRALGIGAFEGVTLALRDASDVDWITPVAFKIGTRVSGADGLWFVKSHYDRTPPGDVWTEIPGRAGRLLSSRSMARFTTEQVWGVYDPREGRPPGILGALALVGGSLASVVPLLVLMLVGLWCLWWMCVPLAVAPVALAHFGGMLLLYISEGGLGVQDPIGFIISIIVVSAVHRWVVGPRSVSQRMAFSFAGVSGRPAGFGAQP